MSKAGVVTLSAAVPLLLSIIDELRQLSEILTDEDEDGRFKDALTAGLDKLTKYDSILSKSQLYVVAIILDPRYRTGFWEKASDMGIVSIVDSIELQDCAQILLETVVEQKAQSSNVQESFEPPTSSAPASKTASVASRFMPTSTSTPEDQAESRRKRELTSYLDAHLHPCSPDMEPLDWWREHEKYYPSVARVARDILAVQLASR